jgi:serine/threonine-protein kinase
LPNSRGPATAPAGTISGTRRKAYDVSRASQLSGIWASVTRWADSMRGSVQGRRQLTAAIVVIGLLLIVGGWYIGFGRYTNAPDLVRLTQANAAQEAQRLGFTLEVGSGRYDEAVPKDTVLSQSPPANARIVKGGTVTVSLSLGQERYRIPSVAGQAVDVATQRLEQLKFVVQTKPGFSDTLPEKFVTGTDPPEGTAAKPNETVTLIVVSGPFPVHVPTVVGKTRAEAQAALAGFTVEFAEVDNPTAKKDVVLDQNPPGGQGMETSNGVKVTLTVAKGPPGVPMPRVLDQQCSGAAALLQSMGFVVELQGNDFEKGLGRVRAQTPQPDVPTPPGSSVQLVCQLF